MRVDVVLRSSEDRNEVVQTSHHLDKDERTRKSEGHGEDYGQGQYVALVLCGEEQVDKDDTKHEYYGRRIGRVGLLARHAAILEAVALRQVLVGHFLNGFHGFAAGVALGRRAHHVD